MALLSATPTLASSPRRSASGGVGAAARGLILALALVACAAPLSAQTFMTQDEALALAFPAPATVERRTAYLTEEQMREAARLAGPSAEKVQGVLSYYVARRGSRPLGVAYFDVHRVRTLPEVLMVVVGPEGRVQRVEVIKFAEPPDYLAPAGWLAQFHDQALSPSLSTKGDIVNMTGATLTSRAVTDAVRRVLALHGVLRPFAPDARTAR